MIKILNTVTDDVNFKQSPLAREDAETQRKIKNMVGKIRREGWPAVVEYSLEYDDVEPESSPIVPSQLEESWRELDSEAQQALKKARKRIGRYQKALLPSSRNFTELTGGLLGDIVRPLNRVGCYIPGGRVPMPSSVLMTAYIAEVAGVEEIIICSPPGEDGLPDPTIQAAAHLLEDVDVYGIGGVQAVAAMAYGAGELPAVDLVAGPGNNYVTLAKKEVYGDVDIDMLAGPSEIAIIAEQQAANPRFIAADLLSQAEHDPRARAYLFTPHLTLAEKVREEINELSANHPHEDVMQKSLRDSALIVTSGIEEAISLSNQLAPEHLELHVIKPMALVDDCENAGAIFCGDWTPEAIGDYVAGPSHTLPTGGSARFFSPLSVYTFIRHQSLVALTEGDYREIAPATETLAELESLPAHKYSSAVRLE